MKKRILVFFVCLIFLSFFSKSSIAALIDSEIRTYNIHKAGFSFSWSTALPCAYEVNISDLNNVKIQTISDTKFSRIHEVNFSNGSAGKIYRVEIIVHSSDQQTEKREVSFATQSNSSGKITVYFNHPVNTSVAKSEQAIYLNKSVDDTLIRYINRAQSTIDIAIYNSDGPSTSTSSPLSNIAQALNNAYSRGVNIRVIYNGDTQNDMLNGLNSAIKRLASPIPNGTYGIMHNKFVIFDADVADANRSYVWTGSCNWTNAQINKDPNNVIIFQDQSLARSFKIEFEEMWGSSGLSPNTSLSKFGPYKNPYNTPETFLIGGVPVYCYFSPSGKTTQKIIESINSANADIEIASMVATRDDIRDAILMKHTSGLDSIHIQEDDGASQGDDYLTYVSNLPQGQVKLWPQSSIMHHKFCIVDERLSTSDPLVLTGSHNWSNSAQTANDENTVIVHDSTIANIYLQAFDYLFKTVSGGQYYNVLPKLNSYHSNLKVYPNPASEKFFIDVKSLPFGNIVVQVTDMKGKLILESNFENSNIISLSTSDWSAGLYYVKLQCNNLIYGSKVQVIR